MGSAGSSLGDSILFPAPDCSYSDSLPGLLWIEEDFPHRPSLESSPSRVIEEQIRKDSHRRSYCFPAVFLEAPSKTSNVVVLYWHGNSCDLGHIHEELDVLGGFLDCHCLAIEYPGYGLAAGVGESSGSPRRRAGTAEIINKWSRAALNFLLWLGVPASNIICFGRSIGTGPAAHLAAVLRSEGTQVGGVVLHSPYISVHKIVAEYASLGTWLIENHWSNAESLSTIAPSIPLLVIHGEDDEVIPTEHGRCLLDGYAGNDVKEGFFPADSSHNAYYIIDDLAKPLERFLAEKALGKGSPPFCITIPNFMLQRPAGNSSNVEESIPPDGEQNSAGAGFKQLLECGLLSGSALRELVDGALEETRKLEPPPRFKSSEA